VDDLHDLSEISKASILQKDQVSRNCAWASSAKLILRVNVYGQLLLKGLSYLEAKILSKQIYKRWSQFDRNMAIEEFFDCLSTLGSESPLMAEKCDALKISVTKMECEGLVIDQVLKALLLKCANDHLIDSFKLIVSLAPELINKFLQNILERAYQGGHLKIFICIREMFSKETFVAVTQRILIEASASYISNSNSKDLEIIYPILMFQEIYLDDSTLNNLIFKCADDKDILIDLFEKLLLRKPKLNGVSIRRILGKIYEEGHLKALRTLHDVWFKLNQEMKKREKFIELMKEDSLLEKAQKYPDIINVLNWFTSKFKEEKEDSFFNAKCTLS
jgi:hypothetical protein